MCVLVLSRGLTLLEDRYIYIYITYNVERFIPVII